MMTLFNMSVQGGLLILAFIIFRTFTLQKLPKHMFLILWAIVLLRLLVPFSISSPYSIYPRINHATTQLSDIGLIPSDRQAGQAFAQAPSIFTLIWLGGALLLFSLVVLGYLKSYRTLRYATPIEGNTLLDAWRENHQIRRSLTLLQSDRITTPLAIGLIEPRIILPSAMDMENSQLLQYVLLHEYYHIRRFDIAWKIIALCAVCVHWYNPLVWLMLILFNQDLELSCDETVLHHFGAESKASYAYVLIAMAEYQSKDNALLCGFSKNTAEERIKSIMKYKKSSVFAIIIAAVMVVGISSLIIITADETANEEQEVLAQNSLVKDDFIAEIVEKLERSLENDTNEKGNVEELESNDEAAAYSTIRVHPITGETMQSPTVEAETDAEDVIRIHPITGEPHEAPIQETNEDVPSNARIHPITGEIQYEEPNYGG